MSAPAQGKASGTFGGLSTRVAPTDVRDDRAGGQSHRHTTEWFTGDGATTEFFLAKNRFGAVDDVSVNVNGSLNRPSEDGTLHDYKLRGVHNGYDGEKNGILFTVAPPAGKHIAIQIVTP